MYGLSTRTEISGCCRKVAVNGVSTVVWNQQLFSRTRCHINHHHHHHYKNYQSFFITTVVTLHVFAHNWILYVTMLLIIVIKSRLSLIVRVNLVLNRTVVVDSDWRFDNLCGSYLQSQSEVYHISWWYYTLVIDLIGQLRYDVIGGLSVKLWCYWLWRLGISKWCVSIRLLSQLWCWNDSWVKTFHSHNNSNNNLGSLKLLCTHFA